MSDESRLAVAEIRLEENGPPVEHVKVIRNQLAAPAPGVIDASPVAPTSSAGTFAYLRMLHGALRGRYWWVIPLSLICAAGAGAAGWKLLRPTYHSEGLLRIAYTLPEVMQETDQNKPLAQFETFIQSQRLLITSRRVIDMAVQDTVWKATARQVPAKPDEYFAENLKVDIKPRSEFILISVTDRDPGTAAAAVTAIINAYTDLYNSQDKQLERQRIGVLEDKQSTLRTRIEDVNKQIKEASKEYGTSKLDMFYEGLAARVTKLGSALADLREAEAMAPETVQPANKPQASTKPAETSPEAMTPEQIAQSDPVMRDLLKEESAAAADIRRLRLARLGPSHQMMIAAQQTFEAAKERVRKYVEMSHEFSATTGQVLGGPNTGPVVTAGKSLADLRASEARLIKVHDAAYKEMVGVGNKRLELQRLLEEAEGLREELQSLNKRIEVLRAEGSMGGRLTVISTGEIPLSPDKDRRIPIAAIAAGAGMCLPVGFVLLASLAKRKYRYSDDAHADASSKFPLLGILPDLDQSSKDGEQMAAAAHSIHQIRVSLRSQSAHDSSSIYLVTSATAGEGKTSLAMSLGLSFAASRLRTLVIDCDVVGRRLTENLQAAELEGLYEALAAGSLKRVIRRTKEGVYVLPVGKVAARHGSSLPAAGLSTLFDQARKYFDVILVDSGPILGSVEAAVVAREVDGVVFAISRGQDHGVVLRAVHRLESLGGRLAGCVFNRASRSDFDRLPYGSSWASAPVKPGDVSHRRLERFGPLVQAVAGTMPAIHN